MPVLMTVLFILSLPLAVSAAEYKRLGSLASVADGPHQELNRVKASFVTGELRGGDTVFISLPRDFSFNCTDWTYGETAAGDVWYGNYDHGCYIHVPWDQNNGLNMAVDASGQPVPTDIFTVTSLRDNEFSIKVNPVLNSLTKDAYFFIYLKDVDVPRGYEGAIALSFDAPGGSGFGIGEVLGGRVGLLEPVDDEKDKDNGEETGGDEVEETDTAPGDEKQEPEDSQGFTAVFTLGSTTFTLNGVQQEMDVAPYAKDGRAYMPMRYAAKALGIKDSAITWENGTARFIMGEKTVSVTIGSPVMYVNGTAVTMDAVPEIVNGRTMLPIKWIGTAFGINVTWEPGSRQVTIE